MHLTYDVKDNLTAGIRTEWFRDQDGFRVGYPARTFAGTNAGSSYYAVTAGLNWKPVTWLNLRPNVRYDWADGSRPFDNSSAQDQFLFSTDFSVNF